MKISAFMPITNAIRRGDTFLEAIQTHLYWADELIVVDGGSIDGSIEAIQDLKDSRIRIVHFPWNQESWSWSQFAHTWNVGLDEATGDWVAAGESDHIFHESEAKRIREELLREENKGKAVVKCQKLQSASWDMWQSKSQMYYFIHKAKYNNKIRYGFDPNHRTDLAHPIWFEGSMYEDIPAGEAIVEGSRHEGLIGGTGANLYNYLWTFKTFDMVYTERMKAAKGWNAFSGFRNVYNWHFEDDQKKVRIWIRNQILSVREKAKRALPLHLHPAIMQQKIKQEMVPGFIGSPDWNPEVYAPI